VQAGKRGCRRAQPLAHLGGDFRENPFFVLDAVADRQELDDVIDGR